MDEAKSAHVTRIANADIVGTYVLEAGPGTAVTIVEKEGRLVQRVKAELLLEVPFGPPTIRAKR
jgi:hypothetical protein